MPCVIVYRNMTANHDDRAREAAGRFCDAPLLEIARFGSGNINRTYLARFGNGTESDLLVIQRINGAIFPNPHLIVANTLKVGACLDQEASRAGVRFVFPRLIPDRSGNMLWTDSDGTCWRATGYAAGTATHHVVRDGTQAAEVGRIIGLFHRLTVGLDVSMLHDTLPGYHDTPRYLAQYDALISSSGKGPFAARMKAAGVQEMISEVEAGRGDVALIKTAADHGACRLRVMHGDPKSDNVLIETRTGAGVGLIDFDTLKPGLWNYDFGDAARSVANTAGEDAPQEMVHFDMELFIPFARAYIKETGSLMTDTEKALLGESIRLLSYELGLRFLSDYLAGDVYFRVDDPDRNRRRAMVQFKLCAEIRKMKSQIEDLITKEVNI